MKTVKWDGVLIFCRILNVSWFYIKAEVKEGKNILG
jgi:hypothetical protein